jgi:hypothetical protein
MKQKIEVVNKNKNNNNSNSVKQQNNMSNNLGRQIYFKNVLFRNQPFSMETNVLFFIGVLSGFFVATWLRIFMFNCSNIKSCCQNNQLYNELISINDENTANNKITIFKDIPEDKNLVFIGVMTAQK